MDSAHGAFRGSRADVDVSGVSVSRNGEWRRRIHRDGRDICAAPPAVAAASEGQRNSFAFGTDIPNHLGVVLTLWRGRTLARVCAYPPLVRTVLEPLRPIPEVEVPEHGSQACLAARGAARQEQPCFGRSLLEERAALPALAPGLQRRTGRPMLRSLEPPSLGDVAPRAVCTCRVGAPAMGHGPDAARYAPPARRSVGVATLPSQFRDGRIGGLIMQARMKACLRARV